MSLQNLPRYREESVRHTRQAMLNAERTLTSEVRAKARQSMAHALRRGTLTPRAVAAAAQGGDIAIATLMQQHHVPLTAPTLKPEMMPAIPAPRTPPAAVRGLAPWVRMLAKAGALSPDGLQAMAIPNQAPATLYLTVATAWESWKAQILQESGLPKALPPHGVPTFDVRPAALDQFVPFDHYDPREELNEEHPSFALGSVSMTHIGLRAHGDNYLAIVGALESLMKQMAIPLISHPRYVCEDAYPYIEEVITDLETIAVWNDDGTPHLPPEETCRFLEEFGFDPDNRQTVTDMETHLAWRRWSRETPTFEPASEQAARWREAHGNDPFGKLYDAIVACIDVLSSLPTCRKLRPVSNGHLCAEQLALIPTGIGIDGWLEEMINSTYQSGEVVADLRLEVQAKPGRLADYGRRVVMEVAIVNLIAAYADLLD